MQERRVNVRGIIFKNGKLFAQQLKVNAGPDQFWCTPGGGLDPNESLSDGLYREMIEETGITPKIGRLLFIQQFNDGTREQLEFFFHIENADDYEDVDFSKASHGDLEIEANTFIDTKTEKLLPTFLKELDIQEYISSKLPIYVKSEL